MIDKLVFRVSILACYTLYDTCVITTAAAVEFPGNRNYPWLCPPPAGVATCPGSYTERVGKEERRFYTVLDTMLLHRQADPDVVERHPFYEAFVSMAEGLRIVDCVAAYAPPCMPSVTHKDTLRKLCDQVVADSERLRSWDPEAIERLHSSHLCWQTALDRSTDASISALNSIFGTACSGKRVDASRVYEWVTTKTPFPQRGPLAFMSAPWLLYPSAYAPLDACNLADFGDLSRGFLPEDEQYRPWRDVSGLFAPYLDVQAALRRLSRRGRPLSRFIINLGASRGHCAWGSLYDPANCLLEDRSANVTAILFEGAAEAFPSLLEKYGRKRNVHLRLGYTTPSLATRDVLAVMPRDGDIDLLKVDVDNCDSCFVQALLQANVRPKLIHVEYSFFDAPMLKARLYFQKKPKHGHCGSLSEFLRVAPGYKLLHVEYVNAVFVREDLYEDLAGPTRLSVEDWWRLGFFCHPLRLVSTWGAPGVRAMDKTLDVQGDKRVSLEEKRAVLLNLHPEEAAQGLFVASYDA